MSGPNTPNISSGNTQPGSSLRGDKTSYIKSLAPKGSLFPALMIGVVAGIDNITAALAMGALMFTGSLASGMGLGVGVVLLGGALLAATVALRSALPSSIALVQETTIAILAAAIIAMTIQSSGNAETKVATAVALIGVSSITTGVLFWTVGRLKLGGMVRFLPYPVVAGFLAGSGWLLIDGAASMLTGSTIGPDLVPALGDPQIMCRVISATIFAVALYVALGHINNSMTMPALMVAAVAVFYLVLQVSGISIDMARDLGHLPMMNASGRIELPTLGLLGQIDWWAVLSAWPSFLVIAGLSMIGLMLNVSGLDLALGRDLDVNAELRSSGLANIASGSVGGPSGFVGLSMTVLAEKTGATGRASGLATAVVMLLGVLVAGSLIFQVPIFLTGGFVLFLGVELVKEWLVDTRRSLPLSEWLIVVVIVLVVALVGFMEGLGVGLLVSSAMFMYNYSKQPVVRIHATGVEQRSTVDRSPAAIKFLSQHGEAIEIVQLQGYLFFGTADRVVDIVRKRLELLDARPLRYLVLDFRNVSGADSAAITCFVKISRLVEANQVATYFTNVPQQLQLNLKLAGLEFGENLLLAFDEDVDHALEKAEEALLSEQLGADDSENLLNHLAASIGPHRRLEDFIGGMEKLEMAPDEVLIKQGENADDVYFVASGRVRVQITLPNGQTLRLRKMLAGAIVGEIAVYLKQERTADVVIDVPSTIFRLGADDLRRFEKDDPELAALAHRLLASNLSEKLSVANRMIQLAQS